MNFIGAFFLILLLTPFGVFANPNASFKADGKLLPTLDEHLSFIQSLGEETTQVSPLENISYDEKSYNGLVFDTTGIKAGTKVEQKITYIEIFEGLYKLVFIEGKSCVRGTALRDGEWVSVWGCEENFFPISSAYGQLFILKDKQVDIKALSKKWGTKILANKSVDKEENFESSDDSTSQAVTQSLGDMESLMKSQDFTWNLKEGSWTSPSVGESFKAIYINVSGQLDERKNIKQEFVYVREGEEGVVRLKSIDGQACEFIERIEKNICEDIFSPTRKTPFPLKLRDTFELSDENFGSSNGFNNEELQAEEALLKCGSMSENYSNALKFYFEGSSLAINEVSNFRKVFSKFPVILDPDKVLLSESDFNEYSMATQAPFIFDDLVSDVLKEVIKGPDGKCDAFIPYIEDLKEKILKKQMVFNSLLEKLLVLPPSYQSIKEMGLALDELELMEDILNSGDPVFKDNFPVFVDVALGAFDKYVESALTLVSNKERFLVAAAFKQDAYSGLLVEEQRQNATSVAQGSERKFFGVSFKTGVNGSYIFSTHPDVTGILPLDEIVSINNEKVSGKSFAQIDSYFLDSSKVLNLELKRGEETFKKVLEARSLDISKAFYSLKEIVNDEGNTFIKIKLKSFLPGLAQSLFDSLRKVLSEKEISGYILDLRGNKGGSADEAFKVASFFVSDKNLGFFSIGYRLSALKKPIASYPEFFINDEDPVLVLVDQESQSASEALAASLDGLNRSYTVGTKTFGKQVAQDFKAVNLSSGEAGLALITTSEYFDSLGRSLNGKGLVPRLLLREESPMENVFDDGNSKGRDYEIPADLVQEQYDLSKVENAMSEIREEVFSFKGDINKIIESLLINKL